MSKPTSPTSVLRNGTRVLFLGDNVFVSLNELTLYPTWFWGVIAAGFIFCTLSCVVWFVCAMCRLKNDKPCNHAVLPEGRTGVSKSGYEKADSQTQKSEKQCQKRAALSEAESLAKSFKSIRSKKSTKSTKSTKSRKESRELNGDDKKEEEKPDTPELRDDDETPRVPKTPAEDLKDGSKRNVGGGDGSSCIVDIDSGERAETDGEREAGALEKLIKNLLVIRS